MKRKQVWEQTESVEDEGKRLSRVKRKRGDIEKKE